MVIDIYGKNSNGYNLMTSDQLKEITAMRQMTKTERFYVHHEIKFKAEFA